MRQQHPIKHTEGERQPNIRKSKHDQTERRERERERDIEIERDTNTDQHYNQT